MKNIIIILIFAIAPIGFAQSLFEKYEDMDNDKKAAMIGIVGYLKYLKNDFAPQNTMATARLKL